MSRPFNIVVFGATGYTGSFVVRDLALKAAKENISWAVAGRSQSKLTKVLNDVSNELKIDITKIETLVVDVNDSESIKSMCDKANLVINCVGPYRFHGEKVVKQCVESKTHHVDISGEPEFLEKSQLLFNDLAVQNEVFVVGSCGFDSVPCDLGIEFTKKEFAYDLNHIESYMTMDFGKMPPSLNFATWESAVYGFGSAKNLGKVRKQLFKERLPKSKYSVPRRGNFLGYFYDSWLGKYCFPFMGSDKSVVQRTQYFNYHTLNQRPIQYAPYFTISSFLYVSAMIAFGLTFSLLANFKFGRYLLLKYYRFFSFGLASKKETKFDEMKDIKFSIQFRGVGFDKKLENKNEQFDQPPTKKIVTEVQGPEPGYIGTSRMIVNCALVLLKEADKIPVKGGVLTPGAAFASTSLIDRLKADDFKFLVLKNESRSD